MCGARGTLGERKDNILKLHGETLRREATGKIKSQMGA